MLRINKLTDYSIVILVYMAKADGSVTSREISEGSRIPQATTSKILKILNKSNLLISTRGASGGYSLAKEPSEITVSEVITAMEGPPSITECCEKGDGECPDNISCDLIGHWAHINLAISSALFSITLKDLLSPISSYTATTSKPIPYPNIS